MNSISQSASKKPLHKYTRLVPLSICLISCLQAYAEEVPPQPIDNGIAQDELGTDEEGFDSITIIGDAQTRKRMAGVAHVIETDQIRGDGSADINHILRSVPGVYVRSEDGYGLFPNISIRGVDTTRSAKVTLLEDGIPTAPAPYSAPAAYFNPQVDRMSGIEVRKGSSQIRFGPHTTGGVINYVSTAVPFAPETYAKFTYGTDNTIRLHGYSGQTIESNGSLHGFVAEVYHQQTDGFKDINDVNDPNYPGTDDTGFSSTEPMIKYTWSPAGDPYQQFDFKLGYTITDANASYLGLIEDDFIDDPYQRYPATRFDNFEGENIRGSARYLKDFDDNNSFTATLYGQHFKRDWFKLFALRDIDIGSGTVIAGLSLSEALNNSLGQDALRGERAATLQYRHNDREYTLYGLQLESEHHFEKGAADHKLSLGLRLHHDEEKRFQSDVDYDQDSNGHITNVAPYGLEGFAGHQIQETDAIALYGEDEIQIGDWKYAAGLRLEFLNYHYEVMLPQTPSEGSDDLVVFSGGLGASYALDTEWTIFGDFYRGVSTPTPSSYIEDGVKEEESYGIELGARYTEPNNKTHIDTAFFASYFNDLLVIDSIGGTGTGAAENVGQVLSVGIEFSAETDLGLRKGWSIGNPWHFAITLTDSRLVNDAESDDPESIFAGGEAGNLVPYIPQLSAALATSIQKGPWEYGIGFQYQSKTYSTANNTDEQLSASGTPDSRFGTTDSFLLMDINTSFVPDDRLNITVGITNVFDEAYVVSRHPAGPRPGRPQFMYVSTEYKW